MLLFFALYLSIYLSLSQFNVIFVEHVSQDSTVYKKEVHGEFLYINTNTLEERTYEENYSLGEFLYRLHFFDQIEGPKSGRGRRPKTPPLFCQKSALEPYGPVGRVGGGLL